MHWVIYVIFFLSLIFSICLNVVGIGDIKPNNRVGYWVDIRCLVKIVLIFSWSNLWSVNLEHLLHLHQGVWTLTWLCFNSWKWASGQMTGHLVLGDAELWGGGGYFMGSFRFNVPTCRTSWGENSVFEAWDLQNVCSDHHWNYGNMSRTLKDWRGTASVNAQPGL